jgi:hypothetical protein
LPESHLGKIYQALGSLDSHQRSPPIPFGMFKEPMCKIASETVCALSVISPLAFIFSAQALHHTSQLHV